MIILKHPLKVFHSDYFSGWNEDELQNVLDNCDNPSDAANPDAFCSDFLTFRGKPKEEGVQIEDDDIAADLEKIQPDPIDIKGLISPEEVTGIPELPRGVCQGTLIPCESSTITLISKKVPDSMQLLNHHPFISSYHPSLKLSFLIFHKIFIN